jgi:hypothetical protein
MPVLTLPFPNAGVEGGTLAGPLHDQGHATAKD